MRVYLVVLLLLFSGPAWGVAFPDSQSQNQGQLQGQVQGQGQVSNNTNVNANVNSNVNNNTNSVDNHIVNTSRSVSGAVSGSSSGSTSGSSSSSVSAGGSATGGSATAYGGSGGAGGTSYNDLAITYESKRELPGISTGHVVGQLEYRGPYGGIFRFVAPWTLIHSWKPAMLENFPSCGWGCDVIEGYIGSFSPTRFFKVVEKSRKTYMGTVLIYAKNPLAMWRKVAERAFESGAVEIVEGAFDSTFTNKSSGWNLGLGGGVTAVSNGRDSIGGSVGGGTGIGSVETGPVEKAQAVFHFFSN